MTFVDPRLVDSIVGTPHSPDAWGEWNPSDPSSTDLTDELRHVVFLEARPGWIDEGHPGVEVRRVFSPTVRIDGAEPAESTDICTALVSDLFLARLHHFGVGGLEAIELASGESLGFVPRDTLSAGDTEEADGTLSGPRVDTQQSDRGPHPWSAYLPPGFAPREPLAPNHRSPPVAFVDMDFRRVDPDRVSRVRAPGPFESRVEASNHGSRVVGVFQHVLERIGLEAASTWRCFDVQTTLRGMAAWIAEALWEAVDWLDGADRGPGLVVCSLAMPTASCGLSLAERAVARLATRGHSFFVAAGNKALATRQVAFDLASPHEADWSSIAVHLLQSAAS